ncbi:hypothetical protein [Pseudaestuariivita atlantica]|uniref:Uncharacterized protein n=1 Tax=Pseudaestuariivita atlantica TaxID=1317121 RepID=A0A0L1JLZ5_9RHOB|nr:hypothetical protein [Pseudaestuariivita atlantica]KNG92779.1 hypothetical protein ATO11_14990 [Pseudaestuariivita atlantica]
MKHWIAAALALVAAPLAAQDFSEGSEARSWNLYAEQPALFEAKVVDILCELTGDCPDNCGDGRRQLGLVRAADNVLVFPNKNSQPAFTGAALELLPYCGQDVEVDGLMIEDPDLGATNVYLVQKIRTVGAEEWVKANTWTKKWAAANPEAKGKGPWFRRDPRVNAAIEADGYLGLGVEEEAEFIKGLHE